MWFVGVLKSSHLEKLHNNWYQSKVEHKEGRRCQKLKIGVKDLQNNKISLSKVFFLKQIYVVCSCDLRHHEQWVNDRL